MPLLAPVGAPTLPEVPQEPKPQPRWPVVEGPHVTWTPAGGDAVILSESGGDFVLLRGVMGVDMPPEQQFETPIAGGDGAVLNHSRAGVREVMLPIRVRPALHLAQREALRRDLVRIFDRRRGAGVLTWQQLDGTARHLTCTYASGLESGVDGHRGALRHTAYQVVLRAHDPYWFGDELFINFHVGPGAEFFPLPFTISPSITTGDSTVTIDGEVEVWPVWELEGPMTSATLRHRGTGQALELTPNLTAGQTLVIRTDPRTPPADRFRRGSSNVWGAVAGDFPVFWSLQPGDNDVTVLAGGTTSQSRLRLAYSPRYLSA